MSEKDLSDVYDIECLLYNDPWTLENFQYEINNKSISFPFIVEEDNDIIGYIICWYFMEELHIGNIAVIPNRQREGIGKFMLRNVFNIFSDFQKAFLEVRESNKKAINLYRAFGFEIIHKRKAYYPNGEDALVMIKKRSE